MNPRVACVGTKLTKIFAMEAFDYVRFIERATARSPHRAG